MLPFQGVSVELQSNGKTLPLYDDPDHDSHQSPRKRQQYIEAITGAAFKVVVTFTQDFPLFHLSPYDAVRTSINYEGRSTSWYRDFTTTNLIQLWRKRRPVQHVFSHISRFCSDTQQWKSGESTFRALKTSECIQAPVPHGRDMINSLAEDSMDSATSLAEMKGIGKISVTVHRVHRIKRAIPRRSIVGHQKPITEVSEKVLKGKAIANTVQQVSVSYAYLTY